MMFCARCRFTIAPARRAPIRAGENGSRAESESSLMESTHRAKVRPLASCNPENLRNSEESDLFLQPQEAGNPESPAPGAYGLTQPNSFERTISKALSITKSRQENCVERTSIASRNPKRPISFSAQTSGCSVSDNRLRFRTNDAHRARVM